MPMIRALLDCVARYKFTYLLLNVMLIFLVLYLVISYIIFVIHRRISVINDLFVQLNSYVIYSMCHVEIFEQIKTDGWMDGLHYYIILYYIMFNFKCKMAGTSVTSQ